METKNIGYLVAVFSILLLILLVFVKINYDKNASFTCETIADNPNIEMEECPYHDSSLSWLLTVSFGVVMAILLGGLYLIMKPRESEKDFKEVDESKLSSDEKKIYEVLKSNKGSVYQSDLVKETGLSKVKVTRTLDKLESKGVAERKRRGMTNLVVLK